MSRSRVKSSEEYDKILGLEKEKEELATTNNAIEYFESMKKNRESSVSNPFDKTLSLKEIKANLRSGSTGNQVESIKAQIASMQANFDDGDDIQLDLNQSVTSKSLKRVEKQSSLYQDILLEEVAPTPGENLDNTSIYQKNASQLYDNLRESRPEVKFNTQNKTKTNQELKKVELVEKPSSLTEQRVKKLFVNSNILEEDEPVIQQKIEVEKTFETEIAADFTGENKTLLESIRKAKVPEVPLETKIEDDLELFIDLDENANNTNKVLEVLPEKAAAFEEMLINEEPQMISQEELSKTGLIKKRNSKQAKETTYHEIRLPKNSNDLEVEKPKKSSMIDNIIIIILIILIVVLGYLLYKAFV